MARQTAGVAHSEQSTQQTAPRAYRPLPAEQETIIRWDREGDGVHMFSADPMVWRRLERAGLTPTRSATTKGLESGRWYVVPKAQFRYKPAGKAIRA